MRTITPCYAGVWWTFYEQTTQAFFACHSCYAYLTYLLLKDCICVCWDPLQCLWVNRVTHRHWITKAWRQSDERLCWQAEEVAAAPGLVHSHRRVEDWGLRGEREEVEDIDLPELQVQTGHNRHQSLRQTDRAWSPAVFLVFSAKEFGLIYNNI